MLYSSILYLQMCVCSVCRLFVSKAKKLISSSPYKIDIFCPNFFQPASKVSCQDDRGKYMIDEIKTRYPSLTIENTNTVAIIDVRSIDAFENIASTQEAGEINNGTTAKTVANIKTQQMNQNEMVKLNIFKVRWECVCMSYVFIMHQINFP
jgi:hypothetical protein